MRRFGSGKEKPDLAPRESSNAWVWSGSGYIVFLPDGTEKRMEGRRPTIDTLTNASPPEEWLADFDEVVTSSATTNSTSSKRAYVHANASSSHRPHECHAKGCTRQVDPVYFMCTKHWRIVPQHLKILIWNHYKPGQEAGNAEVSQAYLSAAERAINAVAKLETHNHG